MLGNPPIVLLDEPSAGMDPEARRFMWSVVEKISMLVDIGQPDTTQIEPIQLNATSACLNTT